MTFPWYMTIGFMTLMYVMMRKSGGSPDWTRMPNPFSKEFQGLVFMSLTLTVLLWPLVWVALYFKGDE